MSPIDIEVIRRRLRSPFPMKGLERRLFVAISLILVFGMVLSICKHDWQYLERTGSLIIVVTIGLGWKNLVTKLGDVENLYRNLADRKLAEIEAEPDGLGPVNTFSAHQRRVRS
jgi:hypothetical protein